MKGLDIKCNYAVILCLLIIFFDSTRTKGLSSSECHSRECPSQVAIANNEIHICGGSLLNIRTVLTAAHCFRSQDTSRTYTVMAGDVSVSPHAASPFRQIRRVSQIIPHPDYNPAEVFQANDFTIVKLSEPFLLSPTVKPINIIQRKISPGTFCEITGWGIYLHRQKSDNSNDMSYKLMKNTVELYSNSKCKDTYQKIFHEKSMICGEVLNNSDDVCQADSGGGLICNDSLAGVISFGVGCGYENDPGVYADVFYARTWIQTMALTQPTLRSITGSCQLFHLNRMLLLIILISLYFGMNFILMPFMYEVT